MKDPRNYEGCYGVVKDPRHIDCKRRIISVRSKSNAVPIFDKRVDGKRVFVYYFAEDSFLNKLRNRLW